MRKFCLPLLSVALFSSLVLAQDPQPPKLELPPEVHGKSGTFIVVTATTAGSVIRWVPLDAGLSLIPPELLKDSKSAVTMAPKGRYRLLAYTAAGDLPSLPTLTTVVVDNAQPGEKPPVTNPPTTPPVTPPVTPPTNPPPASGQTWGVIVVPPGPMSPELATNRKDEAWERLRKAGVVLAWLTRAELDPTFADEETDKLKEPFLLVVNVTGGSSKVLSRQALPAPAEAEKLLRAAAGLK